MLKRLSCSLSAAIVLIACQPNAADRVCDPGATQCLSLSQFQGNIDSALSGKVVGYTSMVGGIPQVKSEGFARTAGDTPTLSWDEDVPINVMSLTKVFTTVAVMQVMAEQNIQLTDTIVRYLPPDWTVGPHIDEIRFQDLLTHRSGFTEGADTSYSGQQTQISDGVSAAGYGQPLYDNNNFALFRVLLPFMAGFSDPGPATRDTATQVWYVDYMKQHVFEPANVTDADTKPTGGNQNGLWYPASPGPAVLGNNGGDWTATCGGGGWTLTLGDLTRFLISLNGSTDLLTDAQKSTMNSLCLGWDCSVQTQTDFVGKNGSWTDGQGGQLWAFMGLFHQSKVMAAVIVNSPAPENITTIVEDAFNTAWVPVGSP